MFKLVKGIISVNNVEVLDIHSIIKTHKPDQKSLTQLNIYCITSRNEKYDKLREDIKKLIIGENEIITKIDDIIYFSNKNEIYKLCDETVKSIINKKIKLSDKKLVHLIAFSFKDNDVITKSLVNYYRSKHTLFYNGNKNIFFHTVNDYFILNNVLCYGNLVKNKYVNEELLKTRVLKTGNIEYPSLEDTTSYSNLISILIKRKYNKEVIERVCKVYYFNLVLHTLELKDMDSIYSHIFEHKTIPLDLSKRLLIIGKSTTLDKEKILINNQDLYETFYFICRILDY
jgi:hypothetical protein